MGHHSLKHKRNAIAQFTRQFRREEEGAMTYFACMIFLMILMVGGIGVDTLISEMRRTQIQGTLDNAVLAAASLEQELDPAVVVQEYIDKSPLAGQLTNVQVEEGLGYRTVRATANTTSQSKIMRIFQNSRNDEFEWTFATPAETTLSVESGAEERIGSVEISMVLDVSGSMNSNSRLSNLKIAAKDFVDTLTTTTEDGNLSISIVPYATQVSAPQELVQHMNISTEHSHSNCVNFQSSDFDTTSIDPSSALQRTMHFDPWNSSDGRDNDPVDLVPFPVCPEATDATREMVVLQKDAATLRTYIDSLWGGGNTSIDVGMKWGTALLDSSLQPVIEDMTIAGDVPADFVDRPHPYNASQTLKVVVLMTDGQNTSQYYIDDDFRTGDSNIWWNEQEEVYSVYIGQDTGDEDNDGNTEEPMYYWPHLNDWRDHAYGEGTYDETQTTWECKSYRRNGSCRRYRKIYKVVTVNEPGTAEVVTYPDLWAHTTLKYNLYEHYYPWMNDSDAANDWYYDVRKYVGGSTKDARTQSICDAAKANDIVVFTIGFEAPSNGVAVLQNCASSISHYFDVDGLEIADAFAAIAASIRQLRLIQ